MKKENVYKCNFCGATYTEEYLTNNEDIAIIQSPLDESIAICDSCISSGNELVKQLTEAIESEVNKENVKDKVKLTPSSIKKHLDDWIIGQDKAKKDLATAVYNHYKLTNVNKKSLSTEIDKSNILLVGPTGVGKTAIIKALGKLLDVPYVIADANSLTQNGYVGRDVEDMLKDLLSAAEGDLEKAQKGIIYMDEIDKLGRKGASPSHSRDISGEGVQQALLKLVEGGIFDVTTGDKKKKIIGEKTIKFDTSQVLFIAGGSFEGIEKIIQKRVNKKTGSTQIGFSGKLNNTDTDVIFNDLITQVNPEDLKNFGMLPELLGRFPVLTALEQLTKEAMINILTKPKNALLKQYKELFAMENVLLHVDNEAIETLAEKALEKKIGARSLRATVEEALKEAMYLTPDIENLQIVKITKDSVENPACTKFLIGTSQEDVTDELSLIDLKTCEAGV